MKRAALIAMLVAASATALAAPRPKGRPKAKASPTPAATRSASTPAPTPGHAATPGSTSSPAPSPSPSLSPSPSPTPARADASLDPIALVGATVMTADGMTLEGATVLFRDGKIVDFGKGIEIPGKAKRIDVTGKVVTPGLVDASTYLGTQEIDQVTQTADFQVSDASNAIHGAFRVVDGLNPASMVIPVARMEGVTSAVSRPEYGLVSGQAAWIHLTGRRVEDMIEEAPVALFGALDEGGKSFAGNSRSAELRKLREAFEDARFLRSREAAQDENRLRPLAASRLDLEALWPVIDRRIPFVIRAQRASDIETALRFARDQKIRVVIEGGAEAWQVADELAAAKVPVILKAMTDLPSSFESLGARFDNAARLDAAGVQIAITAGDTHNVRTIRQEAGIAAAWGLPKEKALAAITRAPAEIFGVSTRLGTIAKGKTADLVVWSGDPLELSTQPVSVWIEGKEVPLRSRQTELLERYRSLPPTR